MSVLLANAPKVPVHLHAKPTVGGTPCGLFKPQRHFRRHAAMPVQKIGLRLARHAKPFGGLSDSHAGGLQAGFPDYFAGSRDCASWFVPFRRSVVVDRPFKG
jgi:hypothetical protein